MNRGNVQFLLLPVSIVIALSVNVNGSKINVRPSLTDGDDGKKMDNFLYVVNNTRGQPCILANMSINFMIPYEKKNTNFNVPNNATVQGHCSSIVSEMTLSWKEGKSDKDNTIKFTFINDHTNFTVFSIELNIYKDKEKFPNDGDKWFVAKSDLDLHLFPAFSKNGIHKCDEEKKVKLNGTELIVTNVSLIAFNNDISSRKEVTNCINPEKDGANNKTFPYIAKWKNNTICGLLRMSVTVQMSYMTKDLKMKNVNITVPTRTNVIESCTTDTFDIELVWSSKDEPNKNSIIFHFSKIEKNLLRYVIINIFMDKENFPNATNTGKNTSAMKFANLFPTPVNGIYSCTEEIAIATGNDINVTISDTLLIPYDVENNLVSKKVADCKINISEFDFNYIVRNEEEIPCILANMNISIDTSNSKNKNKDAIIVPLEAKVNGSCDTKRSQMELMWTKSKEENLMNNIIFYIARNKTDFFVYQIEVNIYADKIHKMSDFGLDLFSTSGIYNCTDQNWQIKLDDIVIDINNVLFTAFNTDENLNSKTVTDCSRSQDSTTSPIVSSTTETTTDQSSTTPEPDPYVNEYNYVVINEKTHVACIAANMTIFMKIPYVTKQSKTNETILTIPASSTVTGNCGSTNSTMELTWFEKSESYNVYKNEKNNSFKINFQKDESNYLLHSIELNIYMDKTNFPNSNEERYTAVENIDMISAPLNNLYKCGDNTSVKVKNVDVTVANVTLIAFNTENKIATKSVMCIQDTSPNIGLIIGCTIGAIMILGISALLMYLYFSECLSCSIFSRSR
ncbi:uncharacterized protein LOC122717460 [Apis laboriosa]|uniref:uncharacterized protein LOC122717460 n=1 Tax=Apis laboriosa TaxID=183418 RepID=UPI001CC718BD|nr:uncharacterized protein LOC122717460 [Apis laboriosa]